MAEPRTLYHKIWEHHQVPAPGTGGALPEILYIDLHLIHEVTSPQAFSELARRGLRVRRPGQTIATMDHSIPTEPGAASRLPLLRDDARAQLDTLATHCRAHGVPLYPVGHEHQGIVHVMGPELGLTQPGMTVVCGDSHTSTHGAFGALAFGIGTSEVGHVLATQCLLTRPSKTFEVRLEGTPGPGVTAKDLILAVIARIGVSGGTGHVFEYTGSTVRALSMEGRMTLCNMSIEGGARAGLIAPDDTTFQYLAGRPFAPRGEAWERALARWRTLPTDEGAPYDRSVTLDARAIEPMITFGHNPAMAIPIRGTVPEPATVSDSGARRDLEEALTYMALEPGKPLLGHAIDTVFLGSCTNSRLSDLEAAARVLEGRRIAPGLRMLVVPGSRQVQRQAEARGLDTIFRSAGAEWRDPGCSMCLAMNDDRLRPGERALSTSNRNFQGRQGPGSRTFLASPLTAAASALAGRVADIREVNP
jgi:3-isopropylmalate/(R)-2-methylmalate dehydratase large subunit